MEMGVASWKFLSSVAKISISRELKTKKYIFCMLLKERHIFQRGYFCDVAVVQRCDGRVGERWR
jgi:hypothetical protein